MKTSTTFSKRCIKRTTKRNRVFDMQDCFNVCSATQQDCMCENEILLFTENVKRWMKRAKTSSLCGAFASEWKKVNDFPFCCTFHFILHFNACFVGAMKMLACGWQWSKRPEKTTTDAVYTFAHFLLLLLLLILLLLCHNFHFVVHKHTLHRHQNFQKHGERFILFRMKGRFMVIILGPVCRCVVSHRNLCRWWKQTKSMPRRSFRIGLLVTTFGVEKQLAANFII